MLVSGRLRRHRERGLLTSVKDQPMNEHERRIPVQRPRRRAGVFVEENGALSVDWYYWHGALGSTSQLSADTILQDGWRDGGMVGGCERPCPACTP